MNLSDTMAIPDVQGSADTRQLAINKVGIKSIRHPVKVMDKSGGVQHTIAVFNMYVGLPHNFKGTHMSRFVEILNGHEREISVENFPTMLREMVERHLRFTGSTVALAMLDDWEAARGRFVKVFPNEYRRALTEMAAKSAAKPAAAKERAAA